MLAGLTLAACNHSPETGHVSRSGLYYDTAVSIDLYGSDDKTMSEVADECMDMCSRYEKLFNKSDASTDISSINSKGGTVKVNHDTAVLISESLKYCELSGGRFDITVKPLSDLWDFHEGSGNIPSRDDVEAACRLIDYTNISADTVNNTVTAKNSLIDPGGSAKGYIADRIAEHLINRGISGAIVNIGGDIRSIGTKKGDSPFTIGIRDPFNKGEVLIPLSLTGRAVATSGIYERCFTKDGKLYHHILDTKTGFPCETDVESATVITGDALSADCLGTICILYGSDKALELINSLDDTEAILILTDRSVKMSDGADRYIRQ